MGTAPRMPGGGGGKIEKIGDFTAYNGGNIVYTADKAGKYLIVTCALSTRSYDISSTGTLTALSECRMLLNWNSSYGDTGNGTQYVHLAELKAGDTVTLVSNIYQRYMSVFKVG